MPLNVIIATSEAVPFAKTGGLGDVSGALPPALKRLGCNVSIFMPFYRQVALGGYKAEPTGMKVMVPIGRREVPAEVLKGSTGGVPVYFIRRDEFYDRAYLYGTPEGDYFDNLERFAFFSRAVLEALKARGFDPDVIHCNDWQTGLIPAYLKDAYRNDLFYSRTATVFTIHNLAYQGVFPAPLFDLLGLSPGLFTPAGMEFWGNVNLLKAGLVYSDAVTTVSRAYSNEIQTEEYGCGLEGVLKGRHEDLYGILNGVDYSEWDPSADALIPERYSPEDMSGKAGCRKALLKEFNLRLRKDSPVIGMITRFAAQKGFDILFEAIPRMMELDLGLLILGSGEARYQAMLEGLMKKYPKKLSMKAAFDNRLAHLVEAGSDIFLMPSRYEPCGLNQIYSLKYGAVPVVRATGGLEDTVKDTDEGRTGFKFKEYSPDALVEKVREAVAAFKDRKAWGSIQRNGMKESFSWEASARKYMEVYDIAVEKCLKTAQQCTKNPHNKPSRPRHKE